MISIYIVTRIKTLYDPKFSCKSELLIHTEV